MRLYNILIIVLYMLIFAIAALNMNSNIINNVVCFIVGIGSILLMLKKIII